MTVTKITQAEFDEKVAKSNLPVLLDFFAEWCMPCKVAEPVLEELAEVYKGKIEIMKVDVDINQDIAIKHQVMSIPTTIMFKGGREIDRQIGFAGKEAFENLIKKVVS